ncbi:hypothetical protein [Mycolicibacterium grossiae]|uniref:Uncharacterized protein n=1 Tax=Mycolicibacterium grossiae TaxID=1552759 RepID=A0A1E8PXT2_9MYCO|nr:hypothetical protein [Mycolicibacterium grossiae]OFJ50489.1 hypothetical protein BEL07_27905 [Mycolicibacterium grossiae]QEM46602.1 hypothetical protein FZ046_19120 [Mycolicibacterium grossiae]
MREPLRIALRVLGLVLLLVSVGCLVLLVWPGPGRVAEVLGVTCGDDGLGPSRPCSWLDAADLLWTGFVLLLIAGFVLRMWTRPEGTRPFTIDLGRRRS